MLDAELERASQTLAAAVMSDDAVPEAMSGLAEATGSLGAALIASEPDAPPRIVGTPSIDAGVRLYLAGDAPPDPRVDRVKLGAGRGFAVDFEDFSPEEIERDPFYAEFLLRHGGKWHASAWIEGDDGGREVVLCLKRSPREGHFARHEIERLDSQLGLLRTTFALRRTLGGWHPGAAETILERSDRGIAWLDRSGGLMSCSQLFETSVAPALNLSRRRLVARSAKLQDRLDAVLASALHHPGTCGTIVLSGGDYDARVLLRFLAPDRCLSGFFPDRAVLVTALALRHRTEPTDEAVDLGMQAFGLTAAEARVATLVACGWSLDQCAPRLGIRVGTLRNHLKSAFVKTGVSRQVELAVLLGPMIAR